MYVLYYNTIVNTTTHKGNNMEERICKICGDTFTPKSSRQTTCYHRKVKKCPVCGKEINYTCNSSNVPVTCSRSCASKYVKPGTVKKCRICGTEFVPRTPSQKYCGRTVKSTCEVCGKPITYHCGDTYVPTTCGSEECLAASKAKRSENKNETRTCPLCNREFHPVNNTQKYCKHKHYFTCVVCDKKFYEPLEEIKLNNGVPRKTCSKECLSELHSRQSKERDNEEITRIRREHCLKKYGVTSTTQLESVKEKMRKSYQRNHPGYTHQSHNPKTRSRQAISRKVSKLELRISAMLDNYDINYMRRYMIQDNNGHSHEFDFYIPIYKILLDADGVYFHSYLSDPDGNFVGDSYDPVRIGLVPKDHIFIVAIEGHEEDAIKEVKDIIKSIDNDAFNYDSYLFKWCRETGFPYPTYSNRRMKKDYNSLCTYRYEKYKPNAKLGYSIIKNFHKSLYDVKVGKVSVREAWEDDELLKKVIENRLIYKNDVDPSKVLSGFNISKVCPIASIFNPVLAKYLIENYLQEFNEVFDPFSGFSGRLLGVSACGKKYIGQDINVTHVHESNNIIYFLNMNNASVSTKDIFESEGEYQCLLTCPPYNKKEIYGNETVFKTCDQWIDECLNRFRCRRYVFIVDKTDKYKDSIVMNINKNSHLYRSQEHVIMLDR